jgi:multiple sugar transport system permease protein
MRRQDAGRAARILTQVLLYAALTAFVILINYPFFWMLSTSLKSAKEVYRFPPPLLPDHFIWANYAEAWKSARWARYFLNTTIASVIPAVSQMVFGSLAAYAFVRKFRGSQVLFFLFLGTLMIPGEATMIPNYIIVKNLGWIDSYSALTVPFLASAFGVFLLRQFFLTVPRDLEDAASIDGSGPFRYLFRILMPLSLPALLTVALFAFLNHWNDFIWPLIVTNKDQMRVIQVGLETYQSEWSTEWTLLMAACTFTTLPVIVLFLLVQRRFIEGITLGGLKQ